MTVEMVNLDNAGDTRPLGRSVPMIRDLVNADDSSSLYRFFSSD